MKALIIGASALSLLAATALTSQVSAQQVDRTVREKSNGTIVTKEKYHPGAMNNARRNWGRGQRLPAEYYGPSYAVDYNRYHLRRPNAGYRWVRRDNQFLLVAATTGLIADAVIASQ